MFYISFFKLLNNLLDNIFYYKILLFENTYYKIFYSYLFPEKFIIYARLHIYNKTYDITNSFTQLINNNNHNVISWDNILQNNLDINTDYTNNINNTNNTNKTNNIDEIDMHLDIKYMFDGKSYKIIYHNLYDTFTFPPYSREELEEYNKQNGYKNSILSAELITDNTDNTDNNNIIYDTNNTINDINLG